MLVNTHFCPLFFSFHLFLLLLLLLALLFLSFITQKIEKWTLVQQTKKTKKTKKKETRMGQAQHKKNCPGTNLTSKREEGPNLPLEKKQKQITGKKEEKQERLVPFLPFPSHLTLFCYKQTIQQRETGGEYRNTERKKQLLPPSFPFSPPHPTNTHHPPHPYSL